jgi:hypothetical protein
MEVGIPVAGEDGNLLKAKVLLPDGTVKVLGELTREQCAVLTEYLRAKVEGHKAVAEELEVVLDKWQKVERALEVLRPDAPPCR